MKFRMLDNPPDDLDGLRRIVEDDAANYADRALAAEAIQARMRPVIEALAETALDVPEAGLRQEEKDAVKAVLRWQIELLD